LNSLHEKESFRSDSFFIVPAAKKIIAVGIAIACYFLYRIWLKFTHPTK
jgi:hypothetical protein